MVLATISFNQVFIIFLDYRDILGGWIYTFTFLYLLTYIGVIYLNLFWLFPKFFAEKTLSNLHILTFSSNDACPGNTNGNGICILFLLMEFYERASYFSIPIVMDYISSFMLSTLCMIGGTMTVLLKEWMIDHQRVSQMEKVHVLSEVEQLKRTSQPRTSFQNIASFGGTDIERTGKTSKMLMKLSQLLRYQLYDCSRTKVLLSSEINFLNNYLTLEQNSPGTIQL